jgi:hypothetical protein
MLLIANYLKSFLKLGCRKEIKIMKIIGHAFRARPEHLLIIALLKVGAVYLFCFGASCGFLLLYLYFYWNVY